MLPNGVQEAQKPHGKFDNIRISGSIQGPSLFRLRCQELYKSLQSYWKEPYGAMNQIQPRTTLNNLYTDSRLILFMLVSFK